MFLYFAIIFIFVICLYFILTISQIYKINKKLKKLLATIETHQKQKLNLTINLLDICQTLLEDQWAARYISKAINLYITAKNHEEMLTANLKLSLAHQKVFNLSNKERALNMSEEFLSLQSEIIKTEERIAFSRQFYNNCIDEYNKYIKSSSAFIIANILNLKPKKRF